MNKELPPDPDDQLFLLLQSMGMISTKIPLWQYQQSKRTDAAKGRESDGA